MPAIHVDSNIDSLLCFCNSSKIKEPVFKAIDVTPEGEWKIECEIMLKNETAVSSVGVSSSIEKAASIAAMQVLSYSKSPVSMVA